MKQDCKTETCPVPQCIEPDVSYELNELMARTGQGKAGIRRCRRDGLDVRYVGRKAYVLGRVWIEYVLNQGKAER